MASRIKSWYCPCEGRNFPFDHYTSGECSLLKSHMGPMPLPAILAIMESLKEPPDAEERRAKRTASVTAVLQCPREKLIQEYIPQEGIDIRKMNSRWAGNVFHTELEKFVKEGYAEIEFPRPGEDPPIILGEPMSGRLDYLADDFEVIEDYKFHSENSYKMKGIPSSKPDIDAVQLNILRLMVAKSILKLKDPEGYRPKLIIQHSAQTSEGRYPWIPMEQPYLSEEELGKVKPFRGSFTVKEILQMYRAFRDNVAEGMSVEDAIKETPLVGRDFMFGQTSLRKCLEFCDVKEICDGLQGIEEEMEW